MRRPMSWQGVFLFEFGTVREEIMLKYALVFTGLRGFRKVIWVGVCAYVNMVSKLYIYLFHARTEIVCICYSRGISQPPRWL